MTILTGNLQSVSGTAFGGPGCFVVVYSRLTRPGFSADALILELRDRIPMPTTAGGHFETEDLDPGPIRVELEGGTVHGRGWDIDLPETGTHSLASLIDAQVEWSPAVVGRAEAAAAEAAQAAVRAEAAAVLLESALSAAADSVRVEVAADADRAEFARQGAETARDEAQSAATAAAGDVRAELQGISTVVEGHAQAVDTAVVTIAGHLATTEGHAQAAGVARTGAETARDGAVGAAGEATAARTGAEIARDEAVAARQGIDAAVAEAAGHAQTTAQHVNITAGHVDAATAARTGAEIARDEAVQAAANASTGAPGDGWQRTDLSQDVQTSLGLADTAIQVLPDEFPPAAHSHTRGDVAGLQEALDGKSDVGHRHSWDQVDEKPATFPPTIGTTPDTAAAGDHSHTAAEVGAAPADHSHTPASIGAAPASHTHSEYAEASRVTALEGNAPIIVSALPSSPLPGLIYYVTE